MKIFDIYNSLSLGFRLSLLLVILVSLVAMNYILEEDAYDLIYSKTILYLKEQVPFLNLLIEVVKWCLTKINLWKPAGFMFQSVFNFALVILFFTLVYFIVTLLEDIRKRIQRWHYEIDGTSGINRDRHVEVVNSLKNKEEEGYVEPDSFTITHPNKSEREGKIPPYLSQNSKKIGLSDFIKKYNDNPDKNLKIGIVLAGGGAKGAYQAGSMMAIYKILEDLNALNYVRMISGTSIGSWNAMFWLTHNITNGVLRNWWHTIEPRRIVQPTYYIPVYNNYILSNKSWQGYFSGLFTQEDFKDHLLGSQSNSDPVGNEMNPHFYFTRTNVESAELECSTNHNSITDDKRIYPVSNIAQVKKAVFMSMDIPPLFKRMKKEEEWFEDGGVIDNLPIKFAFEPEYQEECNLLFILPLNASFDEEINHRSIFTRLMRVMDIRQGALENDAIKDMMLYHLLKKSEITAFIICPKPPLEIGTIEFWKAKEAKKAFDLAYSATKKEIEKFDFSPNLKEIWMTLYDSKGKISYKKFHST